MSVINAAPDLSFDPSKVNAESESSDSSKATQRIKLEPKVIPFPTLVDILYNDTTGLAAIVNSLFRPVFSQYKGSKIEVVQNRQLLCSIFFVDKAPEEGKYKAIQSIIDKDNNSSENRIFAMNQIFNFKNGNRKWYKLTNEAKDLLMDFIPNQFFDGNGKIRWENAVREGSYQLAAFQQEVYIQVAIDIYKVLKAVYGADAPDGGKWQYQVNIGFPVNPVNTMVGQQVANKWQVFIMRVNSKDVDSIASQYGFATASNQMGIITT